MVLPILCLLPIFELFTGIASEANETSCHSIINSCLRKRKVTYERVLAAEISCCSQAFDDGVYSYEKQEECVRQSWEIRDDECPTLKSSGCYRLLNQGAERISPQIDEFRKGVRTLVGPPVGRDDCPRYATACKEEALRRCRQITSGDLIGPCSSLEKTMENTSISRDLCINQFGHCLADNVQKEALYEGCLWRTNGLYSDICLHPPLLSWHCIATVSNFVQITSETWRRFTSQAESLVEKPNTVEECGRYQNEVEEELMKACALNQDKDLIWHCDVITSIIARPYAKRIPEFETTVENYVLKENLVDGMQ